MYTERLLVVLQISTRAGWVEAFEALAARVPRVIVPRHGAPTGLEQARRDTLDYLAHMRAAALDQFEAGVSSSEAARAIDQSAWARLENFELLSRGQRQARVRRSRGRCVLNQDL